MKLHSNTQLETPSPKKPSAVRVFLLHPFRRETVRTLLVLYLRLLAFTVPIPAVNFLLKVSVTACSPGGQRGPGEKYQGVIFSREELN